MVHLSSRSIDPHCACAIAHDEGYPNDKMDDVYGIAAGMSGRRCEFIAFQRRFAV
jgi:hypothetical protein